MIVACLVVALVAFFIGRETAKSAGPQTYEDCVLATIGQAQNQLAVAQVTFACQNKFGPPRR